MTVINTNVKAIVSQESMRTVNLKLATAMERLSTGLRINSAKDDAAGLAISERMTAQVRGLGMAIKNANDGLSMAQTADGAYGEVTSMLHRMRELAVQAATGSMSPLDRQSIQLEIEELKMEIENVATKTHFNNIKLLDGSAQEVVLQVGANQHDIMKIGFDSVRTKDIGSGLQPALTSVGGTSTVFDAFKAGDLVINGVLVGASIAPDDNISYSPAADNATNASSVIAKVAAINKVSEQSGVIARVNETTVMGVSMDANTGTGTITINGVSTAVVTTTLNAEVTRASVVTAINNISQQTGVRAIDTGARDQGVVLIADDGRNITVKLTQGTGTFTEATTGLQANATDTTYVGTYSLYSQTSQPIKIEHQIGRDISGTGLRMGTFQPKQAIMVSHERSGDYIVPGSAAPVPLAATTPPGAANVGVLNGDTLVINEISIGAARTTDDTASHSTTASVKAASAIAIAAAINRKSDLHGVVAKAEPNVIRSEVLPSFTGVNTSGSISLNGVTIGVSPVSRNAVIESINKYSGQTGVVARAYGEGIELVAEDGRNIVIAKTQNLSAGNLGLGNVTLGASTSNTVVSAGNGVAFYASVSLTSEKAFTVRRGDEDGTTASGNFQALGFREGTFGGKDTGVKVADLNVSTQAGASIAISAVDAALEDVMSAQARSGAFQNRLDYAINVLSESVENITASRSRIQDTDYALEATNLAKAQIISQAATAMLAQANQSQQTVLQLLQ